MGEAKFKKDHNIHAPGGARPRFKHAIVVVGGLVWEHDIDEAGFPTSELRPHYKEDNVHFPKGGYPDLAAVKAKVAASAPAQFISAKPGETEALIIEPKDIETLKLSVKP